MKVNWCASCCPNFGDRLTAVLLTHYGVPFEWTPPHKADLFMVGSILSKAPVGFGGTVLGTGFIQPRMFKDLSKARVLALRGALTRQHVRMKGMPPLGDPGILVTDLPRTTYEAIDVLVVPHYVDRDLPLRHPGAVVGDVTWDVDRLLGVIAASKLVVTSSLHALIAADALGVPHVLEIHPAVHGGLFKFTDYASAFGDTIRPGRERLTDRAKMTDRQAEIRGLVMGLA